MASRKLKLRLVGSGTKRAHSRVREASLTTPSVEDRVQAIMELMVTGQYLGPETVAELSAKWGVCGSQVDRHVGEAARTLRRSVDKAELTSRLVATLDAVIRRRESDKVVVLAVKEIGDLYGLKKTVVEIADSLPSDEAALIALAEAEIARRKGH